MCRVEIYPTDLTQPNFYQHLRPRHDQQDDHCVKAAPIGHDEEHDRGDLQYAIEFEQRLHVNSEQSECHAIEVNHSKPIGTHRLEFCGGRLGQWSQCGGVMECPVEQ